MFHHLGRQASTEVPHDVDSEKSPHVDRESSVALFVVAIFDCIIIFLLVSLRCRRRFGTTRKFESSV